MKTLRTYTHPSLNLKPDSRIFERVAARAIILHEGEILLIYTKRYNDYTFPGGGVDPKEDILEALRREIQEETGAKQVKILEPLGIYDELLPNYKDDYDATHMVSHFYFVKADYELGQAQPEDYEVANGSVPVWVKLDKAIAFNEAVIKAGQASMGLTIERETFVLRLVKDIVLSS